MRGRDWDEREHPRNPEDGRFVDKAGGDWADRLSHSMSAAPAPDDAQAQALRESVLDALDPHGPTRRAAIDIFKELDLDPAWINEFYHIASPAPSREVDWDGLDTMMSLNLQDMPEPDQYRAFATKLMERHPGRFPETISLIEDSLAAAEEPPLAPVEISIADLRARIPAGEIDPDGSDFAEQLQALQFWNAHYGAWQQSDNHHFDSLGRLVLMGDGEDAWDERTTVEGGATMLPATLSRSAGHETVEPGWVPDPQREYYDEEGGYWISGKDVPVREGTHEEFDDDEYEMDDGNEGDAFVGTTSVFFGEQVQWRHLVPKPEGVE